MSTDRKRPSVKRLFRFPWRTPKTIREDVAEEFQFHLDVQTEALIAAGVPETEARAQALREFGDHRASLDAAVRYQAAVERRTRLAWALHELARLPQQCRITARVLTNNWQLGAVIVMTIAVAVGAATTAMSFVSPILLKALPFDQPDRLYRIEPRDAKGQPTWISVPTLLDWQDGIRDARLAAYTILDYNVLGDDAPESVLAARVTPQFFATLGVQASLGHVFTEDEHRPGGERTVVLTYQFWQRRYGSDPGIIGRTIELTGPSFLPDSSGDHRVIGVLAPDFWLFYKRLEVVVPLRPSPQQLAQRNRPAIETILAKLIPGANAHALNLQLATLVEELSTRHGSAESVTSARAIEAQTAHYKDYRPRLLLVLASAALMFMLAILNVAAMLIALAVARHKEFSIRAALGASRWNLFHQTLIEGMLLGIVGGAMGVLIGRGANAVLRTTVPSALLSLVPGEAAAIGIDATVIGAVAAAVVFMTLLCTLITFLATAGVGVAAALRAASRGTTEPPTYGRLRTLTMTGQLILAAALVVTTSVLAVSLLRLESIDLGINSDRVVSFWMNLDPRRYTATAERIGLFERVLQRVGVIPNVQAVSGIDHPATQDRQRRRVVAIGRSASRDSQVAEAYMRAVSPGYFQTVEVPLVSGRDFDASDGPTTQPVAIISRPLAERLWPQRNPLGQQLRPDGENATSPWLTVVGVTADTRRVPSEPPAAMLYQPLRQNTPPWMYIMARTRTDSADITRDVRRAVQSIDPRQPIEGPYVAAEWVSDMTAPLRFVVVIGVSFALLAMLLAFAGVYALTADLSQRAIREIGIRKALGATTAEIIGLFMLRVARPAIPALLIGAVLGVAVLRVLANQIENVAASQLWVPLVVIGFFGALIAVSTFLASRGAACVNPAISMRAE